jgi:Heterokaryon incompatibility protein (HET)
MDQAYHYRPLEKSRREIRLLALEPGQFSDPLICRVIKASLDNPPPYCTLSYQWGDLNDVRPITLNGSNFSITANLDAILRQSRGKDEVRMLWVDAICINHRDPWEMLWQVQQMWDIYMAAASSLVAFGGKHDSNDVRLAFLVRKPLCTTLLNLCSNGSPLDKR